VPLPPRHRRCEKTSSKFSCIETGLTMDRPCAVVWDLLTDTTQWPRWGPSVRLVRSSHRYIRLGTTGHVLTALGVWVPFIITEMTHGRSWSWQVLGIPATGHRVDRIGRDGCRLVFQIPFFGAPYIIVCRMALHRISRVLKNGQP